MKMNNKNVAQCGFNEKGLVVYLTDFKKDNNKTGGLSPKALAISLVVKILNDCSTILEVLDEIYSGELFCSYCLSGERYSEEHLCEEFHLRLYDSRLGKDLVIEYKNHHPKIIIEHNGKDIFIDDKDLRPWLSTLY